MLDEIAAPAALSVVQIPVAMTATLPGALLAVQNVSSH